MFISCTARFLEMCNQPDAMQALTYLQTDISALVNHSDEEESAQFRSLLTHLLSQSSRNLTVAPGAPQYGGVGPAFEDGDGDNDAHMDGAAEPTTMATPSAAPRSGHAQPSSPLTPRPEVDQATKDMEKERHRRRNEIFEEVLMFFDPSSKQPQTDLLDLIHVEPNDM
jgi:muskelin